ncbi:MAG: hypothetical protein KC516_02400 [Nanoarchaeota archaeon]|nr:hypothetical protein [Nanoarchaeota archaeon]
MKKEHPFGDLQKTLEETSNNNKFKIKYVENMYHTTTAKGELSKKGLIGFIQKYFSYKTFHKDNYEVNISANGAGLEDAYVQVWIGKDKKGKRKGTRTLEIEAISEDPKRD